MTARPPEPQRPSEPQRPPEPRLAPVSDRAFAIDAAAIACVSVAIMVASHQLAFMTAFVPAVVCVRFLLWARLPEHERGGGLGGELVFFLLCTALGGFNDWNSVVRHRIYDYAPPGYFPELTTIPLWMLLYWGMILRFLATLFHWRRLDDRPAPRNDVYLPGRHVTSPALRVAVLLALVAVTRQFIYRYYADDVWSWVPFAVALVLYALLTRPDRRERLLIVMFATGGPLVEVAYIQLGDLHHYQLGWLGGVPLWIALWWVLSAMIWRDVSTRIRLRLSPPRSGTIALAP